MTVGRGGSGGRVLLVAPTAYRLGGVQTWLDTIVPDLERAGWTCTVALPDGEHHDAAPYLAAHPFDRWLPMHNPTGSEIGRHEAVARAVRAADPDVVLGINIGATYAGAELARQRGWSACRTAMSIHGLEPSHLANAAGGQAWVDGIIATNRLTRRALIQLGGVSAERVHYAPYGVELPRALPPRDAAGDVLRIAWVGRLEQPQKRVHDLRDILEHLSRTDLPWSLRIAGTGPEEAALRAGVDSLAAAERVAWLGHVPAARMGADVYEQADVLLVTSAWETGPIIAWEAAARGVAVVSSRYLGAGAEGTLVHEDSALLFDIGDTSMAARHLASLRDAGLRQRLADSLRQRVAARYSRPASAGAWSHALEAIAQRPPGTEGRRVRHAAHGRLDRLVGAAFADKVRRLTRRRFAHATPGSEWPHAEGTTPGLDRFSIEVLQELDQTGPCEEA